MKILKIGKVFLYSIISFIIVYSPLLIIKYQYFGNIFAPFFDFIFGDNLEIYNAFAYHIRWSEGWISTPNEYLYI